jgi:hypothetical protein
MYTLTTIFSLPSIAAAQNFTAWSPPGPGAVRSPFPALNSLANHGFLPHNGKGITIPTLITALNDDVNVGADFATAIGGVGLLSVPGNLLATSFDLNNLDEYNFSFEHDASLIRDYYVNGNNYSYNQIIFDEVSKFYNGMNETSI